LQSAVLFFKLVQSFRHHRIRVDRPFDESEDNDHQDDGRPSAFAPQLGELFVRLSENAHQIKNQAYNQDQTNPPAAVAWTAKVESASAKQEN
jgi:hypothetical protein